MRKLILLFIIIISVNVNTNAKIHYVIVGQTWWYIDSLCVGDTLRFSGDSLNPSVYGTIWAWVYNDVTHIYDSFQISSYYNIASTYDHKLEVGDYRYCYQGISCDQIPAGLLIFNCPTTNSSLNNVSNEITIFPNPATTRLNVFVGYGIEEPFTINIIDIQGKTVEIIIAEKQETLIDISMIPQGVYFVKIKGEHFAKNEKLIKITND